MKTTENEGKVELWVLRHTQPPRSTGNNVVPDVTNAQHQQELFLYVYPGTAGSSSTIGMTEVAWAH